MSKAEEIHYKAVIAADNQEPPKDYAISSHADHFNGFVEGYVEGYHQAEEDLKLTWEDMRLIVSIDWDLDHEGFSCGKSTEEYYKEVLKQFNEYLTNKGKNNYGKN